MSSIFRICQLSILLKLILFHKKKIVCAYPTVMMSLNHVFKEFSFQFIYIHIRDHSSRIVYRDIYIPLFSLRSETHQSIF